MKTKNSLPNFGFPTPYPADEESFDNDPLHPKFPTFSNFAEPFVASPKTGRNDPFPCGAGKKFKKCCFTA